MANYYGLILAGGRGTRFWPRSRRRHSKQVLNVVGDRSLIQATVDRLAPLIPPERLWVLTNEHLRSEIACQLPEVPKRQILAEPAQRNTAPAIGLAAHILQSIDRDALMGVFPSDHVIGNAPLCRRIFHKAFQEAAAGKLVVLGIPPRWPETGYGYIEFPRGTKPGMTALPVRSFREKPDLATARRYLASGRFFWNAGMFFWRADAILEALRQHLPRTATLLAALPPWRSRKFAVSLSGTFPRCENISIDYAVLERASNVVGIACEEIRWNDVGSWNAVYELLPQDANGNVVDGKAVCRDSRGNFVDAAGKTIALLGVENLIIVDTADALLVADRARAQQVSEIVKLLEEQKREHLL